MRTEKEIRTRIAACEQQIELLTKELGELQRELNETKVEAARLERVAEAKRYDEQADARRRADANAAR